MKASKNEQGALTIRKLKFLGNIIGRKSNINREMPRASTTGGEDLISLSN